ncbi:MAG TPA: 6-phosphofructokinase [Bryobacteraceae bacterium]|nr:6-phosphofructokinase [Bryobacteraceae bacterium]
MARRHIGILTGGGDVPGLNSVIKGVVYRGTENDCEVVGIRRGWEGLTHLNLEDPASRERYVLPLSRENTRTIDRFGGTILHSTRTNPSKMRALPQFLAGASFAKSGDGTSGETWDMSAQVLKNLEALQIDYLIAIGGDDTLGYAARLDQLGVKVIAIPKTMDNDVQNTEYCIGFSTAITRATAAIGRQRSTVGSHERIGIFRIFGRDAGFTALYTAYVTSIRCCIPEFEVSVEKLIDLLLTEKKQTPSNYVLLVISEGARWSGYKLQEYGDEDAFGHRKKMSVGEALAAEIHKRTSEESIVSDLTYDLRSGEADFVDKMIASTYGNMALEAMLAGKSGVMAALVGGCYQMVPIPDPKLGPRKVDVESMYNTDRYRPSYKNKQGVPIFLTKA